MYGVLPRVLESESAVYLASSTLAARLLEMLSLLVLRARRVDHQASASRLSSVAPPPKIIRYMVGDIVLLAHGQALPRNVKWLPFKYISYGQ